MLIAKHIIFAAVAAVILTFSTANAQPAGYTFGKQLLVNSGQVSGSTDLSNFVMLVNFTDTDLRTVANGGNVENSNGFDIIFTLGDCNTVLDHQIEDYDAATGEYVAWVKIPTLFATSNTNIHMYYGNNTVATDPSTTAVWGAEYAAVLHMNQSPATSSPQLIDYTANTNDGIANGSMTASDLVTGQIGNGIDFDGSNDFLDCGADASVDPNLDLTLSAWLYSRAASGHVINRGGGWDDPGYTMFHYNNGIRIELQRTGEKDIVDNAISINTWHYVAVTYDNSTGTILCFIDGVQQSNTGTHTGPIGNPVENLNIGRKEQNAFYFNGIIDEGRVIMAYRSPDWITTEYNNQNSPNSFYTKSIEYTANSLCFTLPVELINLSVQPINRTDALIQWTTATESNNDYFLLQKSIDAEDWVTIAKVKGAGNSIQKINYEFIDKNLANPIVYYKLLQVDFDGTTVTSQIISLQTGTTVNGLSFYPNPTKNSISVISSKNDNMMIYDMTGRLVLSRDVLANEMCTIDISSLSPGSYIVQSSGDTQKLIKH